MTAAVPLNAAALHVSRRRLIQPGEDGSTMAICRRTYSAYQTTAMWSPYETVRTVNSGPADCAFNGTDGFRCRRSNVRYTEARSPANTELLSIFK